MWSVRLASAGRFEFLEYLPANTQSVVIQPIENKGVVVVGTNVQRGFSKLDQVSLSCILPMLIVLVSRNRLQLAQRVV